MFTRKVFKMKNSIKWAVGFSIFAGIVAMLAVLTMGSGDPLEDIACVEVSEADVSEDVVREGETTVKHIRPTRPVVIEMVIIGERPPGGPGAARVRPDRGAQRLSDVSPQGSGSAVATVEPRGLGGLDVSLGLPPAERSPLREHQTGPPSFRANKDVVGASQKTPQDSETLEF